jgi:hypothetical protein
LTSSTVPPQRILKKILEEKQWRVFVVPEAATIILEGGVKPADLSSQDLLTFQAKCSVPNKLRISGACSGFGAS